MMLMMVNDQKHFEVLDDVDDVDDDDDVDDVSDGQ